MTNIKQFHFHDDGTIPNSILSLLYYPEAFAGNEQDIEKTFASHNWTNSWVNGVFSYHHYHSISHEVLGVLCGTAKLKLGGEQGEEIQVSHGDVIVIPAGVGHKNLKQSDDFRVLGAYPDGRSFDTKTGKPGEYEEAVKQIAEVPNPKMDPVYGNEGLPELWDKEG